MNTKQANEIAKNSWTVLYVLRWKPYRSTVFISRAQYIAIPPNDQCSEDELPCNGRIINGHARTAVPEKNHWLVGLHLSNNKHNGSFICLKKSSTFKNKKSLQQKREVAINKIANSLWSFLTADKIKSIPRSAKKMINVKHCVHVV